MDSTQQALSDAARHHQAGRIEVAKSAYKQILDNDSDQPAVLSQLGSSLLALGCLDDAERALKRVTELFPNDAEAHHNLGVAFMMQKSMPKAEVAFRRSLTLDPHNYDTQYTLGITLIHQKRLEEAEATFRQAAELGPDNPNVHVQLGKVLCALMRFDEAIEAYRKVIAICPDEIRTLLTIGDLLNSQQRLEEADDIYERAARLDPDNPTISFQRARLAVAFGRLDDAVDLMGPVVQRMPEDVVAHGYFGYVLCKAAKFEDHLAVLKALLTSSRSVSEVDMYFVFQVFLNARISTEFEGKFLSRILQIVNKQQNVNKISRNRLSNDKIRIGYLTSFYQKNNYSGFVKEIIDCHDRRNFSVNVYADDYSGVQGEGVYGTQNLSNVELCATIRADGIDVLIELNGFASLERIGLLMMKPSPVMVSWYNIFSTTGLASIDYLLGDDIVSPPDDDEHYREKIYRLPGCYLVSYLVQGAPPVVEAPIVKNQYCTFGSLGAHDKINRETIEVWSTILNGVANSRIVLRNAGIEDRGARFYLDAFQNCGIDPSRVELLGPASRFEFVETYNRIDIALDTFPWNGGTTTMEALWQGAPVVTFLGKRWVSRVAATIVTALGHREWVGTDRDDYVGIAIKLAQDPKKLDQTRREQRPRMAASVLCDVAGFTRKLETAYRDMAREKGIVP